ncbi:MAG: hypothetical protein K2V38_23865 [Gemmataceae bacterium]|nr:hypothetical protein [Gemmataceae bacterium]
MPQYIRFALCGAFLALAADTASAAFTVKVTASLAPNGLVSESIPAYNTYANNAISSIVTQGQNSGLPPATGTAGTPGRYQGVTTVNVTDMVATEFRSWRGLADPGNTVGAAFATQHGNRLHFGAYITQTGGGQFTLAQLGLSFTGTSTQYGGAIDLTSPTTGTVTAFNLTNTNAPIYVGVRFTGPSTYTLVTTGDGLVDAVVAVGPGTAFDIFRDPIADAGLTDQQIIDNGLFGATPFSYTGRYNFAGGSASTTVNVTVDNPLRPVPAPPALVLVASGALALAGCRARQRRQPASARTV